MAPPSVAAVDTRSGSQRNAPRSLQIHVASNAKQIELELAKRPACTLHERLLTMKTTTSKKKLNLETETLRILDDQVLAHVHGGATNPTDASFRDVCVIDIQKTIIVSTK